MAGVILCLRIERKTFRTGDRELPVLDRIELSLGAREIVALVGPSGCGKTTLLRIAGGLDTEFEGTLDWRGGAIARIGTVFQEPRLLPWRSVEDNVRLCLRPLAVPEREARARTAHYLELVGLQGFARYYPNRLSGGMQQRASIARALAVEPDVLLMDEPFSALDAQNRRIMQDETVKLWQETRKTILFVTHSIAEAVRISSEVVVLTARPTTIRAVYTVGDHHDTRTLEDELLRLLSEEVDRQRVLDAERTRQASTA